MNGYVTSNSLCMMKLRNLNWIGSSSMVPLVVICDHLLCIVKSIQMVASNIVVPVHIDEVASLGSNGSTCAEPVLLRPLWLMGKMISGLWLFVVGSRYLIR